MIRFDVFGRILGIERRDGSWHTVEIGSEGKNRQGRPVFIPDDIREEDLGRYLADLFHESASPDRPDVIRLTDG